MTGADAELEWLRHREELRAMPQRYARAIDARDIDEVAALFDPDGTVDGARGATSVVDYIAMLRASPPAFSTTMHVLGDPLITLDVGDTVAKLDTYAVVHQLDHADGTRDDTMLGIHYVDDVVRQGERWLISHRQARILWQRTLKR